MTRFLTKTCCPTFERDVVGTQVDAAAGHTAINTVRYLKRENVQFIEPNMWPPNSQDLNPVDYVIWVPISRWSTVVKVSPRSRLVDELTQAIVEA